MRSSETRTIIKDIAEKENLNIKQVEEIVFSFFRFTSKVIGKGNRKNLLFTTVRLFKFGVFKVKEGRRQDFESNLKIRDEKLNRDSKRSIDDLSGSSDNQGVQRGMDKRQIKEEGGSTEGTGLRLPFD